MQTHSSKSIHTLATFALLALAFLASPALARMEQPHARSAAMQAMAQQAGTTYYVATNGDDGNPGTLDAPFRTIGRAASVVAAGDTVLVRGGQYNEQVVISASGNADARITFAAYPGEEPVIDGSGLPIAANDGLVEIGRPVDASPLNDTGNYVTFKDFTVQNSSGRGISLTGDGAEIISNTITRVQYAGLIARQSFHSVFSNNHIWDTARMNADHAAAAGGWPAAVSAWESADIAITGNSVHDNHGEGIAIWKSTDHFYIADNTLHDNWGVNLYLDNAADNLVEKNVIYETDSTYIPRFDANGNEDPRWREIASGIAIADEDYSWLDSSYTCNAHNNTIRNNVMINVRSGFTFYRYIGCSGLQQLSFESNTIADTWDYAIRVTAGNHSDSVFRNNILYPRAGMALLFDTPGNTRFEDNVLYTPDGASAAMFRWQGKAYDFGAWQKLPGISNNRWADPLLNRPGALHVQPAPDISQGADRSVVDHALNSLHGGTAAGAQASLKTDAPAPAPSAISLPGRIEAEDYNAGGEGVGYHDTTPGNTGGAYHTDDVDIEACSDSDSSPCYNVGWTAAGEWLAYDVQVAQSGTYTFQARVASRYSDKRIAVEIGGQTISLAAPRTGAWQTWATVQSAPVKLDAGTYTLRIVSVTGNVNINYVDVQLEHGG